ncbi:sulfurtransferase TusA family protein [Parvularcula lutaonensis]|uniref:Sulfurtransferase TusA family protein n=1 Tax=Parvularcula lutaonensis TaxID=491923 RepID=A0ABV7M793_9PROT|nr:sulfurtransferase TusA family protein [Parvularcula lutaonensis]
MNEFLDLRGLRCPIPVIKLEAAMRKLSPGQQIRVAADDPLAKIDLPHAAQEAGMACEPLPSEHPGSFEFRIIAPGR